MDTKDIRYFCCVYEEKSINKAARQLFISPQGLSKIIAKLEEELHTTLFERSAKGMQPTESGIYLYENCQELLEKLENLEVGIRRIELRSKELKIGFSCGVLNVFPFDKFDLYKVNNKNFEIRWDEAENEEIIQQIFRGNIDVGFVIDAAVASELFAKEIFNKKPDVLVYEGHPFYHAEQLSVNDLRDETLITLNEKFSCYHSFVRRCSDFNFIPLIKIKTMESQLIYRFCREKRGLGIDVNIHKSEMRMEGIRRIELYDSLPWKIFIVCRTDRKEEKAIRNLFDLF